MQRALRSRRLVGSLCLADICAPMPKFVRPGHKGSTGVHLTASTNVMVTIAAGIKCLCVGLAECIQPDFINHALRCFMSMRRDKKFSLIIPRICTPAQQSRAFIFLCSHSHMSCFSWVSRFQDSVRDFRTQCEISGLGTGCK